MNLLSKIFPQKDLKEKKKQLSHVNYFPKYLIVWKAAYLFVYFFSVNILYLLYLIEKYFFLIDVTELKFSAALFSDKKSYSLKDECLL